MIHNILKFLSIHRDLVRYEAAAKIDTYFVNSIRHIILTEPELKRYLREYESSQLKYLRKSRAIKKSSTAGASSGDLLGGSGSDSDSDSDGSLCSRFSFADKGVFSGDKSSTRDRKFFLDSYVSY